MTLDYGDRTNPLLAKLIAGWTEELAVLRARNDNALSHDETLTLRGRISQLKAHIALGDEMPVIHD